MGCVIRAIWWWIVGWEDCASVSRAYVQFGDFVHWSGPNQLAKRMRKGDAMGRAMVGHGNLPSKA